MNPDPASPDQSVPSQSKTATLGDNACTASRNSEVLNRLTATTLLTESTQPFYAPQSSVDLLLLSPVYQPGSINLLLSVLLFVIPHPERSPTEEESAVVFVVAVVFAVVCSFVCHSAP
jgi:hypothetical protein